MLRTSLRPALAAVALSAFLLAGTAVFAATVSYTADLKGATEVPPNDSKGTGAVNATYDTATKKFTYTATYMGLTGVAPMHRRLCQFPPTSSRARSRATRP